MLFSYYLHPKTYTSGEAVNSELKVIAQYGEYLAELILQVNERFAAVEKTF